MFSVFATKEDVGSNLKSVQDEVVAIKHACKAATKAFKDCMQLKKMESLEAMAQESALFKSGELMLSKAEMVKHSESPVKEILNKTGEVFKTIGIQQANFETTIHHVLDEGKINKSTQDYFQAESEMNELKRRVGSIAMVKTDLKKSRRNWMWPKTQMTQNMLYGNP